MHVAGTPRVKKLQALPQLRRRPMKLTMVNEPDLGQIG